MPISHTLEEMVSKYTAKMNPTQAGTRYGNSKQLAINRYEEGVYPFFANVPRVKNILGQLGVPAGKQGIYFAFVNKLQHYADKQSLQELQNIATALGQEFVVLGADPNVLAQLVNLIVG